MLAGRDHARADMENSMRRKGIYALALTAVALAGLSLNASANWQGTFYYYSDEGVLVGGWTGGCGDADGRWGIETDNKRFVQGCRAAS
jgi:hypothetical protein